MLANIQQMTLAHDVTGGSGRALVLLPAAGDLRSEYRFMVEPLASAGYRVIAADLPGHGDSAPAGEYTVEETAARLVDLIESIGSGPTVVVCASFSPAAAVWAAAERPDLIRGLVAISPHFYADTSIKGRFQNLAINALLRGPWAAGLWASLYTGWYKASPPDDLGSEVIALKNMLKDPIRRRAVRQTLTAGRDGVEERMARIELPTLTVFGSADDHFADPVAEARSTAEKLKGEYLVVEGAGHYPHVEQPRAVNGAVLSFLDRVG